MKKRKWTKDEVKGYRSKHNSIVYFNTNDSNLFVPRLFGIGWSLNYANPFSWIIWTAIIIIVISLALFS